MSTEEGHFPIRSLIYVTTGVHAQPIDIPSPDLMAVRIRVEDRMILVISVFVPPVDVNALSLAIDLIKSAVRRHGQGHELIIAGDFNRHDQLWGGDEVDSSVRQGEAAAIIEMMDDLDLQSLLPRGTKTYEGRAGESTIDLILATAELVASRVMCQPYQTEHRSDHLAISTTFALKVETSTSLQPRRVFKKRTGNG